MTIILKPEQERVLIDAINSGLAHDTAEALDQALEALRRRLPETRTAQGEASAEKAEAFERWARSHPKRPPLPETAFQRENMIRDSG
jgi:hypothetical protein